MMKNKDIKVVFMGTPKFAVPVLEGLIENYHVVLVVCQPDRKKNRKGDVIIPDTKRIAISHSIPVFQPERIRSDYQMILDTHPDLIVTCAYGQIIPSEVIDCPLYGAINVHGSLLPELRGGAPIHWAIIRGYEETGMTIMRMSLKMDAGDIIRQASLKIGDNEKLDSLYSRMSILGRDLLLETIPSILDHTATYTKQDESLVTFGYNISKEDEKIDFNLDAVSIYNLIRGLSSIPGAYCLLDDKRMKVYDAELFDFDDKGITYTNGEIVSVLQDGFICKCGTGFIKITDIGIEGKKRCLVYDYFHGVSGKSMIGKVLK